MKEEKKKNDVKFYRYETRTFHRSRHTLLFMSILDVVLFILRLWRHIDMNSFHTKRFRFPSNWMPFGYSSFRWAIPIFIYMEIRLWTNCANQPCEKLWSLKGKSLINVKHNRNCFAVIILLTSSHDSKSIFLVLHFVAFLKTWIQSRQFKDG